MLWSSSGMAVLQVRVFLWLAETHCLRMAVCLLSGCQGNEPSAATINQCLFIAISETTRHVPGKQTYTTVIATVQQTERLSFYVNVSNSQNSFLSIRKYLNVWKANILLTRNVEWQPSWKYKENVKWNCSLCVLFVVCPTRIKLSQLSSV